MIKVCKIRCYPNKSQIDKINNVLSGCRYVSNLYIEYNIKRYETTKEFLSGYDFAKILTKLKKTTPRFYWLKGISTKALKSSIMDTEKAFKAFFKKNRGFPKFKSRKRIKKESFFFIKDNIKYTDNKNIIKIPILGKIRITEHKYLPELSSITSGRVIKDSDKYYIVFIYETNPIDLPKTDIGFGIDVGVKSYCTIYDGSDGYHIHHFKDDKKYKRIQRKIQKLQQIISHKVEVNYYRKLNAYLDNHQEEPSDHYKNIMKGESYNTSGVMRVRKKIEKLYTKLRNIRKDSIDKLVYKLVARAKPQFITIEDLSISNMIQNEGDHKLHKYITESGFYYFRTHLSNKCHEYLAELRIAYKYFASSKICCICGNKRKKLTLNDRVYKCDVCGNIIDRDENASINLYHTKKYSIV